MCSLKTVLLLVTRANPAVGRKQQVGAESAIELHSSFPDEKWG